MKSKIKRRSAVIPKSARISSVATPLRPTKKSGVILPPVTGEAEYRQFAMKDGPWNFGRKLNEPRWGLIRNHGIPVLYEMFDSLRVGVPFKLNELYGELYTLEGYSEKTQQCILSAICCWQAIQEEPQIVKVGRSWMLPEA